MSMKNKVLIGIAVIVFLYFRKNKKDAEIKKVEEKLKENGLSTEESIDIIRYKLDEYIRNEFAFIPPDRVREIVMGITSNLEQYDVEAIEEEGYNDNVFEE